jgi:hypothetical protein
LLLLLLVLSGGRGIPRRSCRAWRGCRRRTPGRGSIPRIPTNNCLYKIF